MENISNLKEQTKNELKMKEIIYLDKNIIHSFLAQIEDGLRTSINRESSEEIKSGAESEEGYKRGNSFEGIFNTGKFSIPAIFETPSGNMKIRIQPGAFESEKTSIYQTEFGKEIITRQLHDNALTKFEKYMISNNLLNQQTEMFKIGDYIKIKGQFNVFDFKIMSEIFGMLDNLYACDIDQSVQTLDNILGKLNSKTKHLARNQDKAIQTKGKIQNKKEKLENEFKQEKETLDSTKKLLSSIEILLGDKIFMTLDKFILILSEEFMREKAKDLMLKYDNGKSIEIVAIGKITRRINKSSNMSFKTLHSLTANAFEFFLQSTNLAKKDDFIVSPIAVYFE